MGGDLLVTDSSEEKGKGFHGCFPNEIIGNYYGPWKEERSFCDLVSNHEAFGGHHTSKIGEKHKFVWWS